MIAKNKILKIISFVYISLLLTSIANAFGYFRDNYDMFDIIGMHGFGFFMGLGLIALLGIAFLFVFWLLMLIDCLKRDFRKDIEKIAWLLVLIFLHLLGALIYYFVVKLPDKDSKKKNRR